MKFNSLSFILLCMIMICSNKRNGRAQISNIEGLLYLDQSVVSIEIEDGNIRKIVRKNQLEDPNRMYFLIAPGFIDNQVNGYLSVGFSDPDLTVADVKKVTMALWKKGVTTFLPTFISSSR